MKTKILSILAIASALTLPAFVNAQEIDKDLTLSNNINDGIVVKSGNKVTLDLAGYNITNKNGYDTIKVEKDASLTIKGKGDINNTSNGKAVLYNEGELTVLDGNYYRENNGNTNSFYVVLNHGNMKINGGSFAITGGISSLIDNGFKDPSENKNNVIANLTINNGTFTMNENAKYIKNDDYGIMEVNNGTFVMNTPASAIIGNMGSVCGKEKVTINDGNFTLTAKDTTTPITRYAIWDYKWSEDDNSVTIVNGGTYNLKAGANANIEITNGTLGSNSKDPANEYPILGSNDKVVAKESEIKNTIEISELNENSINETDLTLIKTAIANKYNIAGYYNIDLFRTINDSLKIEQLNTSNKILKATINIPNNLPKLADGYSRKYYIVRLHDNKVDILDTVVNDDNTLTFETDKFSTYSLVYKDEVSVKEENKNNQDNVKNPNTYDNFAMSIVIGILSLVGIIATVKLKKIEL